MANLAPNDSVEKILHHALFNFYNPAELQFSPLIFILNLEKRPLPMESLRKILEEAIQAMKPGEDIPFSSGSWRIYNLLRYRFIEQTSQKEVAFDFSLSVRQVRRLEKEAIQLLANYLRSRYDLATNKIKPIIKQNPMVDEESVSKLNGDSTNDGRENEILWLKESQPKEIVKIEEVLQTAMKLCDRMIENSGLDIHLKIEKALSPVTAQSGVLRQAVITLLTAICQNIPKSRMKWSVQEQSDKIVIQISIISIPPLTSAIDRQQNLLSSRDLKENLDLVTRLVSIAGGTMQAAEEMPYSPIFISMPVVQQVKVLIIDDNSDALGLIKRYLEGTRYKVITVRDPAAALDRAVETRPQIILLDVMMPGIDGWELLSRFREHPKTNIIPVIVSTILPQEKLAITLGASAFIRKPFDRIHLVTTLDQQLAQE